MDNSASYQQRVIPHYLELLGVRTRAAYETDVVQRVLSGVDRRSGRTLPIRLSMVAQDFLIDPLPEIEPSVRDGCLEFDKTKGKFVIKLGRNSRKRELGPRDMLYEGLNPLLLRRERFTYAHEFAHRFFFVEEGGTWRRAADIAVAGLTGADHFDASARLYRSEERSCNNIARRLLVPDDGLRNLTNALCPRGDFLLFSHELKEYANTFAISHDCMFVTLRRASDERQIAVRSGFAALLISYSDQMGEYERGRREFRIQSAIISEDNAVKSRAMYPGRRVASLSPDLLNLLRERAIHDSGGPLDVGLQIPQVTNTPRHSPRLMGWWRILGRKGALPDRLLAWGSIS
jgi:hypothetical protein